MVNLIFILFHFTQKALEKSGCRSLMNKPEVWTDPSRTLKVLFPLGTWSMEYLVQVCFLLQKYCFVLEKFIYPGRIHLEL